jgi:hypothetical protein
MFIFDICESGVSVMVPFQRGLSSYWQRCAEGALWFHHPAFCCLSYLVIIRNVLYSSVLFLSSSLDMLNACHSIVIVTISLASFICQFLFYWTYAVRTAVSIKASGQWRILSVSEWHAYKYHFSISDVMAAVVCHVT